MSLMGRQEKWKINTGKLVTKQERLLTGNVNGVQQTLKTTGKKEEGNKKGHIQEKDFAIEEIIRVA